MRYFCFNCSAISRRKCLILATCCQVSEYDFQKFLKIKLEKAPYLFPFASENNIHQLFLAFED